VHPRFNQRIQLMQALAPLARLHRQVRFDSFQVRHLMKFVKVITEVRKMGGKCYIQARQNQSFSVAFSTFYNAG